VNRFEPPHDPSGVIVDEDGTLAAADDTAALLGRAALVELTRITVEKELASFDDEGREDDAAELVGVLDELRSLILWYVPLVSPY
jgi:hypothetical protein